MLLYCLNYVILNNEKVTPFEVLIGTTRNGQFWYKNCVGAFFINE